MRSLFAVSLASIALMISGLAAAADGGIDSGTDATVDGSADAGGDAEVDASLDASGDALSAQDGPSDAYVSDVGVITYVPDGANPTDDAGGSSSAAAGCSCSIAGSPEDGSTLGAGPASVLGSAFGAFGIALAVARRRRRRR